MVPESANRAATFNHIGRIPGVKTETEATVENYGSRLKQIAFDCGTTDEVLALSYLTIPLFWWLPTVIQ